MFLCPNTDLSVGVQTATRAPLCLCRWEVSWSRKYDSQTKIQGLKATVGVNRRSESTDMNIWRPLWGLIKLGPIHICDWSYWAVWRLLGKVPQHQKEVITSLYNKSWRSPPISEWRSQGWPVKAIPWAWNVANLKLYFN